MMLKCRGSAPSPPSPPSIASALASALAFALASDAGLLEHSPYQPYQPYCNRWMWCLTLWEGSRGKKESSRQLGGLFHPLFSPICSVACSAAHGCDPRRARVLVLGFTSGQHQRLPAEYILIKGLSVMGCRAGEWARRQPQGAAVIQEARQKTLLRWAEEGLRPAVSHEFPFTTDGVRGCFLALRTRRVVGRACVTMDPVVHPKL
jgi:hypothetical protein